LPWETLFGAFFDLFQRYQLVSIKEHAEKGFRQGVRAVPISFLRGWMERKALSEALFAEFSMISRLQEVLGHLREAGEGAVVLCGTGRFPSLWIRALGGAGRRVAAFLDTNSCWENQCIRCIPVFRTVENLQKHVSGPVFFLSGLSSLPETAYWKAQFEKNGLQRAGEAKDAPFQAKDTGKNGRFLFEMPEISLWKRSGAS